MVVKPTFDVDLTEYLFVFLAQPRSQGANVRKAADIENWITRAEDHNQKDIEKRKVFHLLPFFHHSALHFVARFFSMTYQ